MKHYFLISLLFLLSLGCRSQENPILEFQKNLIDSEQTGSNVALVYKDGEVVYNHIFTDTIRPLNDDYFKTLWGRFKRVSKLLEEDQTLYSFRHTGAIEIFKRTGSITKLQKAMGHSSINVSLTYLRGLEIAELKEEDMPMV